MAQLQGFGIGFLHPERYQSLDQNHKPGFEQGLGHLFQVWFMDESVVILSSKAFETLDY
ncbi:MAG: hypothetical protein ACLRXB_04850 [Escherichia coli]